MKSFVNTLSLGSIAVGTVGGLGAMPYALSSSLIDVVGAGAVFIAGAVLIAAGLTSLARLAAQEPPADDAVEPGAAPATA